ncbi:hypothetical protein D3C76_1768670 [compost metagenome]
MLGRNGEHPSNRANLRVINTTAVEQRIWRTNGNIRLVINNRIPHAVIHLGGDRDLAGRELFF